MSVLFISSHHFSGHRLWLCSVEEFCASPCVFLSLSGPLCASLCFSEALWASLASLGLSGPLWASPGLCCLGLSGYLWASLDNKNKHYIHNRQLEPQFFLGTEVARHKCTYPTAGAPVSFAARNCKTKRPDNTYPTYISDSWILSVLRGPKLQDKKSRQSIHTRQLEPL